jgi:N-acetylmuramoyl-L-alanine amidase
MLKAIFIDAGHGLGPTGSIDNGASGNGTTERKEVMEMARQLIDLLKKDASFENISILEIGVSHRMMLRDQIAEINRLCTDNGWKRDEALVLSLHCNASTDSSARGLEAWYTKGEANSAQLTSCLLEQVAQTTGLPIRASKTSNTNRLGRLGILDDTIPFGCLFEAGFVTNALDSALLKSSIDDQKFAKGLHRGIRQFLSLPLTLSSSSLSNELTDVAGLAWYSEAVKLCLDEGLFDRPTDGKFSPDRPVTRAELAAIFARHLHTHHSL